MLARCMPKNPILFGLQQMKYNLKHARKSCNKTRDSLISDVDDGCMPKVKSSNKVTVIGAGQVGMACACSILAQKVSNELCLIDVDAKKSLGETLDLLHGSCFLHNPKVTCSDEYCVTAGSRVCIITAGARQKEGETPLSLVQRNADIMKSIIPQVVQSSPETIILMVTNPVDVMTYVAWKLSELPPARVMGSGTALDSARFRFEISKRLGVAPTACNAWIIGENGDSSVPVWSGVNVGGVRLKDVNPCIGEPEDKEKWFETHEKVVKSGYEVIKLKGYTSWAIGLTVAALTSAILKNNKTVYPVSTLVKGIYGNNTEVFCSVPCVLDTNGVTGVILQNLTETELKNFKKSCQILAEAQAGVKMKYTC